mmetsp:Transcript_96358/g.151778  ORF Transcript_96358/g.151778 Transcript_96358/m.151778 type:complete len:203 (+) Transcript_96358:114-722(+)
MSQHSRHDLLSILTMDHCHLDMDQVKSHGAHCRANSGSHPREHVARLAELHPARALTKGRETQAQYKGHPKRSIELLTDGIRLWLCLEATDQSWDSNTRSALQCQAAAAPPLRVLGASPQRRTSNPEKNQRRGPDLLRGLLILGGVSHVSMRTSGQDRNTCVARSTDLSTRTRLQALTLQVGHIMNKGSMVPRPTEGVVVVA